MKKMLTKGPMEINTQHAGKTSEGMILAHVKMLGSYKKTLRDTIHNEEYILPESALRVPFDEKQIKIIKTVANRFHKKAKTVLLVGIGGSDIGTRAVYDALRGHTDILRKVTPRLIIANTIEPTFLDEIEDVLDSHDSAEEIVLIIVSKSGNTTETIYNANVLFEMFSKKYSSKEATAQTIVITNDNSSLAKNASKKDIEVITMPEPVGGRYSVFTAVGLLPLAILGFNIDAFLEGARSAITASVLENKPSSGAVIAAFLFEAYLQGSYIHDLFIWNPELETLGKWHKQLLAESIGKERKDGTKIGFIPTVEIGSIDLHSMGQLIFGGKNDMFTTFVSTPNEWGSSKKYNPESAFTLPMLEDKESGDIMHAIFSGVQKTYISHTLPFITIELSAICERELGAFMALQMTSIMYLAQIFDVNAFDQPAVETYKNEVRRLLTNY